MSEAKESFNAFDVWAIVEIMGHQRYAGRVTEQVIAGAAFLRVEIPAVGDQPQFTKLFSPSSVYAITPVTEQIAVGVAETCRQAPISAWDLPESWREKLHTPPTRRLPVREDSDDDFDDSDDEAY